MQDGGGGGGGGGKRIFFFNLGKKKKKIFFFFFKILKIKPILLRLVPWKNWGKNFLNIFTVYILT